MFVEKLELYKYELTSLNETDHIVYEPKVSMNLLLGKNGSGKSSFMRCLIPTAMPKKFFKKGGYYYLKVSFKGHTYELKSDFRGKTAHHSLIVDDDKELNDGGTLRVQESLIETIFGLTPDIVDILLGNLTLTQMPPSKRREVFMKLSNANLEYVLSIYKRVKTKLAETKTLITHLKGKIAKDVDKLSVDVDRDGLQKKVDTLQLEISNLLRDVTDVPNPVVVDDIDYRLSELGDQFKTIMSINLDQPKGYYFSSEEQIPEQLNKLTYEIENANKEKEKVKDEHKRVMDIVSSSNRNSGNSRKGLAEELKERTFQLTKVKEEINRQSLPFSTEKLPILAKEEIDYFVNELNGILSSLDHEESEPDYKDKLIKTGKEKEALYDRLTKLERFLLKAENKIKHYEECQSVECPKCSHNWKPEVDVELEDNLKVKIPKAKVEAQEIEKRLNELDTMRSEITDKKGRQDTYFAFVNRNLIHKAFLNHLTEIGAYWNHPKDHKQTITDYALYLSLIYKKDALERRIQILTESINRLDEFVSVYGEAHDVQDRLENEYNELMDKIRYYSRERDKISNFNERLRDFRRAYSNVKDIVEGLEVDLVAICEKEKNRVRNEAIRVKTLELSEINSQLNEHNAIQRMIDENSEALDVFNNNLLAYQALLAALSPTEGIIADQIGIYISSFINEMNRFIGDIWTYPMSVSNCEIADGDLNYKFPLDLMRGVLNPEDVSLGSDGQKEAVNLAFKIVAQMSLGLNNLPLYVDEPGRGFDVEHLSRLMTYLKTAMYGGLFPQMFMISHDPSGYGIFGHAERFYLDRENQAA
jgi:hypothetical protein